jgi:hypothetical protein
MNPQYVITSVSGLVPGQIVTFFNDNDDYNYEIKGFNGVGVTGIIYTGGGSSTPITATRKIERQSATITTPVVGWYNDTLMSGTNMLFNGGTEV